jgi:hypothetical protein
VKHNKNHHQPSPKSSAAAAIPSDPFEQYRMLMEQTEIHLVSEDHLQMAQSFLVSCERCFNDVAEISFEYILDALTGCDPARTEYLLPRAARCPICDAAVTEKTLVAASG